MHKMECEFVVQKKKNSHESSSSHTAQLVLSTLRRQKAEMEALKERVQGYRAPCPDGTV